MPFPSRLWARGLAGGWKLCPASTPSGYSLVESEATEGLPSCRVFLPSRPLSAHFLLALASNSSSSSPPGSFLCLTTCFSSQSPLPSLSLVKCKQPPDLALTVLLHPPWKLGQVLFFHTGPQLHLTIEICSAWWPNSLSSTAWGRLGLVAYTDTATITFANFTQCVKENKNRRQKEKKKPDITNIPFANKPLWFCASRNFPGTPWRYFSLIQRCLTTRPFNGPMTGTKRDRTVDHSRWSLFSFPGACHLACLEEEKVLIEHCCPFTLTWLCSVSCLFFCLLVLARWASKNTPERLH